MNAEILEGMERDTERTVFSISWIQRRFSIGYVRAIGIANELAEAGLIEFRSNNEIIRTAIPRPPSAALGTLGEQNMLAPDVFGNQKEIVASLIDSHPAVRELVAEKEAHAKTAKQFVDMKAVADYLQLRVEQLVEALAKIREAALLCDVTTHLNTKDVLSVIDDAATGSKQAKKESMGEDEEPKGICSVCGRKTWDQDEVGKQCNMPQPDRSVCKGNMRVYRASAQPTKPEEGEK